MKGHPHRVWTTKQWWKPRSRWVREISVYADPALTRKEAALLSRRLIDAICDFEKETMKKKAKRK